MLAQSSNNEALRNAVAGWTEARADASGVARTPVSGLSAIRSTTRSGLVYAISRPLVALVLQGHKHVAAGTEGVDLVPGDSMLITADVPTVSQVTKASIAAPYLSLVVDLDLSVAAELTDDDAAPSTLENVPVRALTTDDEVADTALRLVRLLARPASLAVLQAQTLRELHHWLIVGRHGAAIRRLVAPQGHARRVSRAVAILRSEFTRPLPVGRLAEAAGMSVSSFHEHFRAVTSLTPLQFQKHLRLIEARRRMSVDGLSASSAAFAVGYESVSQFTREYGRLFGASPARHVAAIRERAELVA